MRHAKVARAPASGLRNSYYLLPENMSLFKTIMSKIFGGQEPAISRSTPPSATPSTTGTLPTGGTVPQTTPSPSPAPVVDVGAVLDGLSAKNPEKLDWKRSIVDLMKLLDMESSLAARRELATELHYPGDAGDSAKMNIWLHKQVLKKLAENGGNVPADLLD